MATDTTTVRVRRTDSQRLHALAKDRDMSVIDVIGEAIEALERRAFLRGMDRDCQQLQDDSHRWRQYRSERAQWEQLD